MADATDLRARLMAAAAAPSGPLDLHDIRRRAERHRRRRTLVSGVAGLALVLPLVVALTTVLRPTEVEFAGGGEAAAAGYRELADGRWVPVRASLPGDPKHPGITLSLELDDTTVRQGEQWWGELIVTNTGEQAVDLGPWECWEVWGLFQEGVYRGGHAALGCLDEPVASEWWLQPGQSHSWEIPFDTVFEDPDGNRFEHQLLSPGVYEAVAGLQVRSGHHRFSGTWYSSPVRVVVQGK